MQRTIYHGGGGAPLRVGPVRYRFSGAGELDSVDIDYLVRAGHNLVAPHIAPDTELADAPGFFCKGTRQTGDEVEVTGVGVAGGGEKRLRRIRSLGREIALGPVEDVPGKLDFKALTTPSGTGPRWNISEGIVVVEDIYFSDSAPDVTEVKRPIVLTDAPEIPDYVWGNYPFLRFNHPNGWILDSRDGEEIVPGHLWRITESSSYRQLAEPD